MANLARSRGVSGLMGKLNHHFLNHQSGSGLGFSSKLPVLPDGPNPYPVSTHLTKAFGTLTFNSGVLPRPKAAVVANDLFRLNQQFRSMTINKGFTKQHKGLQFRGVAFKDNPINLGEYGLQSLEHARINTRQIQAGRIAMARHARRGGKIWVLVHANKPVTAKPAETRMGRGKGNVSYWAAVIKPGKVLYEMGGVTEDTAKMAMKVAASKLPFRTKFISLGNRCFG